MAGLHSRSFFWQWQAVYAASNPGREKEHWEVDGVSWTKERSLHWGKDYSFQIETHRLERTSGGRIDWRIMVVTERWWGPDRDRAVRDTAWSTLISGRADRVLQWLRKQVDAAP
ncbi:MAG: hypothetical protein ACREFD_09185 [Stellaceae bacterium]